MSLGRRLIPLLFVGWVLSVALLIAIIAKGYIDIAPPAIGLAALMAGLLVVTPALLFLAYAWRHPDAVSAEMRRSAMTSGAGNVAVGVLLAATVGSFGLHQLPFVGNLPMIGAIAMALVGIIVLARVFTLRAAPATVEPSTERALRHRGATIAGAATIVGLALLAPRASGQPESGPTEANMTRDLRTLVAAQDEYFATHQRYGSVDELTARGQPYKPDLSGAEITLRVDSTRFIATATSPKSSLTCLVWSGTPEPPADSVRGAIDGLPLCWKR